GIGYAHVVRTEFTTDETLLCRAEALIYLNRSADAIADLQSWNKSHLATDSLTEQLIRSFYTTGNSLFVKSLNNDKMSTAFTVTANQRPRIETMFDGYRWFDIKRYGIEIEHNIAGSGATKLVYNDARRAIQVPQEVISAGITPNPGIKNYDSNNDFKRIN
ncbi:RagB/SusD family nutrient uptake outer membrane protein, partial [bacterium]|nr:RagB/SusD family nutrient uptake outer membrane protein [bacterium]